MNEMFATQWVRGAIRAEMERRGLTYADLVERLASIGVDENERNLRNKVARGTFGAVFFVQCLEAIGVETLKLDMVDYHRSIERKYEAVAQAGNTAPTVENREKLLSLVAEVQNLVETIRKSEAEGTDAH